MMMKAYRDHDWVSPKLEIRPSSLHGKGMFAVHALARGEVVAVWGGMFVSRAAAEQARLAGKAVQQIDEDVFEVFDRATPGLSYYQNHSCEPNTGMADEVTVVAKRAIRPGEELTIDYAMFEADENHVALWECRCGAPGCRKRITGKDWRLADLQERYAGHFSPLINRRIGVVHTSPSMQLSTERLTLIPFSAALLRLALTDKGAFERQLSARFLPEWASEHQRRLLAEVLRALEADPGSCIWRFYWILHASDRAIIGDAGFKGPPDHEGAVEIAYGIVPSYRRQGYAFEAVETLVRWAFAHPRLRQITARCDDDNVGSIRILTKLGMHQTRAEGRTLFWLLARAPNPSFEVRTILFEVHGESVDNHRGLASGHRNVPLSPRGRQQARALGARYRLDPPAAVFCSDLQRAYATADLAFPDRTIPITRDTRLRECDYGTLTGRPAAQVEVARDEHLERPFPGGESYSDVVRRIGEFVDALSSNAAPERILIIGHRGTWCALEHLLGGRPLPDILRNPWRWRPGWRYVLPTAGDV